MNKGGGSRVSSHAKMRIYRMPFFMNLAGVACFGRLRWQILLGESCLKIAGSDGIRLAHPCFYLTVWFQMESYEALLAVTIMRRDF
jgi:hypothetical protein